MPRSLVLDLLYPLMILTVGAIAFMLGAMLHAAPRTWYRSVIGLVVFLAALAAVAHFYPIKDYTGALLSRIGGEGVLACWAGLLLLGVAWNSPRRTTSKSFVGFAVALACFGIIFLTSGPLQVRFFWKETWSRFPDPEGCLMQSTAISCSPTSATMLLSHYGIAASEGEMAYLAGTSVTGTDQYAMARALSIKVRSRGWTARVEKTGWDACVASGIAFMAHTYIPRVGGHAIFVERLTPDHAAVIDPRTGSRSDIARDQFESWWNGRIIRIVE